MDKPLIKPNFLGQAVTIQSAELAQNVSEIATETRNAAHEAAEAMELLKGGIRVFVYPQSNGEDMGEGGVGRIIRQQEAWLRDPENSGFELAESFETCDVLAAHITVPPQFIRDRPQIPIVGHTHGLYWAGYNWPKGMLNINHEVGHMIRIADIVTSPSEWVTRVLKQQYWRDAKTVTHGVDVDAWFDAEKETPAGPYVLFDKTRVDPVCEIDSLDAVARMCPEIQFVTTAWDNRPLPDNVLNVGRVSHAEAGRLTRNASAYFATTRETFGVSNVQALASAVPIVGYAWGGQQEIRERLDASESTRGLWCHLVEPGDTVALAAALRATVARTYGQDERQALRVAIDTHYSEATKMLQYAQAWRHAYDIKRLQRRRIEDAAHVDVIITAYNLEKYIARAIESVVNQNTDTFKARAIVYVDASPDRCAEIAREYADRYPTVVKVINGKTNLYLAGARNEAIRKHSESPYVMALDADDECANIEQLYQALERDRNIDIAYGGVYFYKDVTGVGVPSGWPGEWNGIEQCEGRNLIPYSSMYRRRVFDTIGGYRTRCQTAEDQDFWQRAALGGFVARKITNSATLRYCIREGSMSHSNALPNVNAWAPKQLPANLGTVLSLLPVPSLDPPVIACVIPLGDGHEPFLLDALDSLYAQTFINWECIVVDDRKDRTKQLYLPPWAKLIVSGAKGVANARNTGIAATFAELFLPIDADDILEPTALETMYAAYVDSDRRSIVYSDFWEDPHEENKFSIYRTPDYNCSLLLKNGTLHAVTALTPVRYWHELGGYPTELYGWEDWGWMMKCAANGIPSRRVPVALFTYRKHTGFRREENYADKERSRDSFMQYFCGYEGSHWVLQCDGNQWRRDEKMACGCATKTKFSATFVPANEALAKMQFASDDGEMIEYSGTMAGSFTIRSKITGFPYKFSRGATQFVVSADVQLILSQPDMRIVKRTAFSEGDKPELEVTVLSSVRRQREGVTA
jgi:glycosyltransferase involved in cell wall biosynthesis